MMKKFSLMLGGLAALAAVPLLAAPGGERPNPDADGNGVITRAEVEADVAKRFAMLDTNKDGKVDEAERAAHHKARAGRMGAPGGDRVMTQAQMRAAALARFDRADANKDGQVTAEERAAMRGKRGEGRHGGPGAPPPEG